MRTIKIQILLLAIFSCVFVFCGKNAEQDLNRASRHFEPDGKYSIHPPKAWKAAESPETKYKIIRGPKRKGIRQTMVFVDEISNARMEDYVKDSIKNMEQDVQQTDFVTAKKLKAKKIVYSKMQSKRLMRISHYILPGKGGVYMNIICTIVADQEERYDKRFDDSVSTFEWEE
ncbi:MAG: hypothetical protein LBC99_07625 [Spirochaetota bacterium]|jgi:hypothetical protein|nr:hypothetical protein [Spirochaetota bacterium]